MQTVLELIAKKCLWLSNMWHETSIWLFSCSFAMWQFHQNKKQEKYFAAFSAISPSVTTRTTATFFHISFATLTINVKHKKRIKTSSDFTIWASCLTISGSPNAIPLYPKITLDRLREHCLTFVLPSRLVCCLSESRLIIPIPGLLKGARRCG